MGEGVNLKVKQQNLTKKDKAPPFILQRTVVLRIHRNENEFHPIFTQ
jgi:hypothetical protein